MGRRVQLPAVQAAATGEAVGVAKVEEQQGMIAFNLS